MNRFGETAIPEAIDYFSINHPLRRAFSVVSHSARLRMYARFRSLCKFQKTDRVIDVGVTPDKSLPESNFFEALYPYPEMLTATSIEDASFLEELYPGLKFVRTGASELPFSDKEFDIAVSFAVLEHVGSRENQRKFVHELVRVARKVFLTTPDRAFPVEVHTFIPLIHWLPQPVHQSILRAVGMEFWAQTENLNLLTARELVDLFPATVDVKLYHNRLLGLSSNLLALASDCSNDTALGLKLSFPSALA